MELYCEIKTEEGIMRGMLNRPNANKYPIVVMLHGFTANRNGPRFAFVRLARELEKHGIGSIRFDFLGSGESDLSFKDMTYMKECQQVVSIIEEVKKIDNVSDIYLLGHSMGGAIAGNIAAHFPDIIKKCCLWAPAFCMPQLIKHLKDEVGEIEGDYFDCKGLDLSLEFVDQMIGLNLYANLEDYKNELMIIHGESDETVPYQSAAVYINQYNRDELNFVTLKNGSHNYEKREEITEVLSKTIEFFQG